MQRIILRCPPQGRYHFGNIALDENTSLDDTAVLPHSDTLFSAILRTANLVDAAQTQALANAYVDGLVRHSSAFFCLEIPGHRGIYFLPKPVHADLWPPAPKAPGPPDPDDQEPPDRKAIIRINYLSEQVWQAGFTPPQWVEKDGPCKVLQGFVLTREEFDLLPPAVQTGRRKLVGDTVTLPKVRVHHHQRDEGYFHQTCMQLADHGPNLRVHYYFFLQHSLPGPLANFLEFTLSLLPDQGIGGERQVGCGQLTGIESTGYTRPQPDPNVNYEVALALVSPLAHELSLCPRYRTVLRGGRRIPAAGPHETFLKRVRLLREGAVVQSGVLGQVVDIAPATGAQMPYLRAGLHLGFPLHPNLVAHLT